ncbi:hypothetical protein C0989_012377, partial [Termitomyces sp. Mn162]
MNASRPSSYDLNERPTRPAGITTPSGSPSVVPCPNGSRTSFASCPNKPPTTGTRRLLPRSTNVIGEDCSENTAPRTSWNTSGNTNWQAGATNGIRPSIPANPANPAPRFPPGRGVPNTNRPPGQRPPAQLNAADLHNTLVPLDTNPNDCDDIPDPANDQEALCANRIQD